MTADDFATVREARPSVPDAPCMMCTHDYCECKTDQASFDAALARVEAENTSRLQALCEMYVLLREGESDNALHAIDAFLIHRHVNPDQLPALSGEAP